MPESRRRRRWRLAFALIVAFALAGALLARHFTRPEALTALLIDKARTQLGATLTTTTPGRFGFMPDLHLILTQPALSESAGAAPFLRADDADVVVPWSILWSDRYEIRRIELASPQLDIDALKRWLAARPSGGQAPDLRFALHATRATIIAGGKNVATNVNLEFASTGDVVSWLAHIVNPTSTSALPPLVGSADAALIELGGTRIENLHLEVDEDASDTAKSGKPSP